MSENERSSDEKSILLSLLVLLIVPLVAMDKKGDGTPVIYQALFDGDLATVQSELQKLDPSQVNTINTVEGVEVTLLECMLLTDPAKVDYQKKFEALWNAEILQKHCSLIHFCRALGTVFMHLDQCHHDKIIIEAITDSQAIDQTLINGIRQRIEKLNGCGELILYKVNSILNDAECAQRRSTQVEYCASLLSILDSMNRLMFLKESTNRDLKTHADTTLAYRKELITNMLALNPFQDLSVAAIQMLMYGNAQETPVQTQTLRDDGNKELFAMFTYLTQKKYIPLYAVMQISQNMSVAQNSNVYWNKDNGLFSKLCDVTSNKIVFDDLVKNISKITGDEWESRYIKSMEEQLVKYRAMSKKPQNKQVQDYQEQKEREQELSLFKQYAPWFGAACALIVGKIVYDYYMAPDDQGDEQEELPTESSSVV